MALRPPISEKDHMQGDANAAIVLVEYGDYQCPHCGRAYPIIKRLQEELGSNLKFIFRNFPLKNIHPEATIAAIASEAAAIQGLFWEMHDIIFENQDSLDMDSLVAYAGELGMDIDRFINDMENSLLAKKVEDDFESGIRSGVNATPTFFINGVKYNNGWEGERLLAFIKETYAVI